MGVVVGPKRKKRNKNDPSQICTKRRNQGSADLPPLLRSPHVVKLDPAHAAAEEHVEDVLRIHRPRVLMPPSPPTPHASEGVAAAALARRVLKRERSNGERGNRSVEGQRGGGEWQAKLLHGASRRAERALSRRVCGLCVFLEG